MSVTNDVTGQLSEYIATAASRELPEVARRDTILHVLDTFAAVASGSRLPAGRAALQHVTRVAPGGGPSSVIGHGITSSVAQAALANGMAGHADETDDSNEFSRTHPGCSIVPAAFAVAEELGSSGASFLRAVTLGYDVAARVNIALWPTFADLRRATRSTHAIGGMFGSAAAIASLADLSVDEVRYLLSYVAQQVSGTTTWKRDVEHIEKAYIFAGWPALGAVMALSYVHSGWPGVRKVFDDEPSFLHNVGVDADPQQLVAELGERFEVSRTNIKRFSVGSPAQAPVEGLLDLMAEHSLSDTDITSIDVVLPTLLAHTVGPTRDMPDINLPYLLHCAAVDGELTFAAAHDLERFAVWQRTGGDSRIRMVGDDTLQPVRQAIVTVGTRATSVKRHVTSVRGTHSNPMPVAEVVAKATDLIAPVLAAGVTEEFVAMLLDLQLLPNLSRLSELLTEVRA